MDETVTRVQDVANRDIYHVVLLVAALPVLAFVIWLSWIITNRLMSPEWQQKRRAAQIRKAVAERAELMAELHSADAAKTREKQE